MEKEQSYVQKIIAGNDSTDVTVEKIAATRRSSRRRPLPRRQLDQGDVTTVTGVAPEVAHWRRSTSTSRRSIRLI